MKFYSLMILIDTKIQHISEISVKWVSQITQIINNDNPRNPGKIGLPDAADNELW